MSRDCFKRTRTLLHFNNNELALSLTDRFYKIRPLINSIRTAAQKIPETLRHEVMIAYKGTIAGNLRKYIATNPDKWDFKFFAHASGDRIVNDFLPYQGGITFENHNVLLSEQEMGMNLISKIVISLVQTMKNAKDSIIYADNYFTSYALVKFLRDHY